MLHWLPFFKAFPLSEIRLAQHLDSARLAEAERFVQQKEFNKTSDWALIFLAGNTVYWGKVKDGKVLKRCFYKTDKSSLEQALNNLPSAKQHVLDQQVNDYLSTYFDRIDGLLVEIEGLHLVGLQLTPEGHYAWRYTVDLITKSTGFQAQDQKEQRNYQIMLNGETGQMMRLQEEDA